MGSSTQPLLQHDFSTAMQQYQSTQVPEHPEALLGCT